MQARAWAPQIRLLEEPEEDNTQPDAFMHPAVYYSTVLIRRSRSGSFFVDGKVLKQAMDLVAAQTRRVESALLANGEETLRLLCR